MVLKALRVPEVGTSRNRCVAAAPHLRPLMAGFVAGFLFVPFSWKECQVKLAYLAPATRQLHLDWRQSKCRSTATTYACGCGGW